MMKPQIFQGTEFEDAFEFIIDWYEMLHMMGILKQYGVEFVNFMLEKDAK